VLPDYHLHSNYSCDANESVESLCRRALELGLGEIGISDHCDHHPLDECSGFFKPQAWWAAIESCRDLFGSALTIRAGLEFGEPHLFKAEALALVGGYPWDYVLGSLHWVGDRIVFSSEYFEQPAERAYRSYFTELYEVVVEGEFDILAHIDIVKRYGFDSFGAFDPRLFEVEIRAVLAALARSGRALEVNTSTLRRPVAEPSPNRVLLRWFREEGGRLVTFGSDAHKADDLGAGWQQAAAEMRHAGFTEYAAYDLRQPELHPLPGAGETAV
jgi:histidinol-phosphatase (PHP family)